MFTVCTVDIKLINCDIKLTPESKLSHKNPRKVRNEMLSLKNIKVRTVPLCILIVKEKAKEKLGWVKKLKKVSITISYYLITTVTLT